MQFAQPAYPPVKILFISHLTALFEHFFFNFFLPIAFVLKGSCRKIYAV